MAQIAWDGSQKVQMRILPIIEDNLALGRSTKLLSLSLACWFEFICRVLKDNREIIDPLAAEFASMPALLSNDSSEVVAAFLSIESVFGQDLKNNSALKTQLADSLSALRIGEARQINNIVEKLC